MAVFEEHHCMQNKQQQSSLTDVYLCRKPQDLVALSLETWWALFPINIFPALRDLLRYIFILKSIEI